MVVKCNHLVGLIIPLQVTVKGIDPKHRNEVYSAQFGAIQSELVFNGQKIADSLPRQLNKLVFDFDQDENVYLEFPLDAHRLEWIEQQRQGSLKGLVRVSISSLVLGPPRGTQEQHKAPVTFSHAVANHGEVDFTVPDAQWREHVLPGLGYGKVIAIELPAVPIESFQKLNHSFKAIINWGQSNLKFLLCGLI